MIQLSSKQQIKQLFTLALPVSIGQAGNIIANMTDSAMLGKFNSMHMIASTLGFEVVIIPFILLIGITIATTTMIATEDGEGKKPQILGSALLTHSIIGVIIGALIFSITFFLNYLHPDPNIVELSKPYIYLMSVSMLPIAVFLTFKQYYEGFGLTLAATISSLLSNALTILLNYWFIFGHFGCEPMGIKGAGYATLISKFAAIFFFIFFMMYLRKYKEKLSWNQFKVFKRKCIEIVKVGVPIGFQMFIEVTAFTVAGIFIGWIGNAELGAHTIALQFAGLTYLMVTGIGSAATVLSGNYIGEKNRPMLIMLIKNVLYITIIYEVITALIFWILSPYMPNLYLSKDDVEIFAIAVTLIRFAAIFQIPDGIQSTLQGILRGIQDVKFPMYISAVVHNVITLGGGYLFAFAFNFGVSGMWVGFMMGLSILAILLYFRLKFVVKQLDGSIFVNSEK
jgi:multidrug resistance protein, MATE family